jgi:glycine/D-amino acid oxidase-like deaminating enzyme
MQSTLVSRQRYDQAPMSAQNKSCDVLIIGGGFYGCEIALACRRLGFARVVLVEREEGILRRASFVNQGRIHNGYHYPRSRVTANRSRRNFERFIEAYPDAVLFEMENIYAIARGSRVSASQFEAFCRYNGNTCYAAPPRLRRLFDLSMIDDCFVTREFVFDATQLASKLSIELMEARVDLRLGTVARVLSCDENSVDVAVGAAIERASWVINCTYSNLEHLGFPLRSQIKKELTEMLLIRTPSLLAGIGVTLMDGPYFAIMPFPAAAAHSLTHVRYTPHEASISRKPSEMIPVRTNRNAMLRDATRYMPCLANADILDSMFEIKAILADNENDDGRPILIEEYQKCRRILSILGSKIDNVFDALQYIYDRRWD